LQVELKGMADRITTMRTKLFEALQAEKVPGGWHHVVDQIGMCAAAATPLPAAPSLAARGRMLRHCCMQVP